MFAVVWAVLLSLDTSERDVPLDTTGRIHDMWASDADALAEQCTPQNTCDDHFHGFVCGQNDACSCDFKCSPGLTRMLAMSPKTGSVMYDHVRTELCTALPRNCIWRSDMLSAASLSAQQLQEGPIIRGADYRLLVSIRDPFRWLVSAYLYYGIRGEEYGGDTDGHARDTVDTIRNLEGFGHTQNAVWHKNETYSAFLRRIPIEQGLLLDIARQIGQVQLQLGLPKYNTSSEFELGFVQDSFVGNGRDDFVVLLRSAGLGLGANRRVRTICLDHVMQSTASFDRIMQDVVEFFEMPRTEDGSMAWTAVGARIRELDIHRNPTEHPVPVAFEVQKWLHSIAMQLDTQYLAGYVQHFAAVLGCAELPSAAASSQSPSASALHTHTRTSPGGDLAAAADFG